MTASNGSCRLSKIGARRPRPEAEAQCLPDEPTPMGACVCWVARIVGRAVLLWLTLGIEGVHGGPCASVALFDVEV